MPRCLAPRNSNWRRILIEVAGRLLATNIRSICRDNSQIKTISTNIAPTLHIVFGEGVVDDQRKSPRQRSRFQSFVRVLKGDAYIDCVVRDISETGARLGFSSPPSVDGDVELHIPAKGVIIQAHVVWAEDCECGVSFGTKYEAEEAAKAVLRFASQP